MALKRRPLLNICRMIDETVKEVPITTSFTADFNKCVMALNESNPKPSTHYKPSSLQCIRNMYYYRTNSDVSISDKSPDLFGVCESGTDRHERIQSTICKMRTVGIDCDYIDVATYINEHNIKDLKVVRKSGFETHLKYEPLDLSFLCDGIICYKGKYYILEIKTESSFKFNERTDVADEHRNQAIAYSMCLGIDDVMFFYENRDFCTKKAFLMHVTDEQRTSLRGLIETCEDYVKKQLVPPKPENVSKKTCSYCAYKHLCKLDK